MELDQTDSKKLLEKILDEWQFALYGELENGVAWLNETASEKFAKDHPHLVKFGEFLRDLENEIQ
jgi:hypothetical protein